MAKFQRSVAVDTDFRIQRVDINSDMSLGRIVVGEFLRDQLVGQFELDLSLLQDSYAAFLKTAMTAVANMVADLGGKAVVSTDEDRAEIAALNSKIELADVADQEVLNLLR